MTEHQRRVPSPEVAHSPTPRVQITTRQLARSLDSTLYHRDRTEDDVRRGCAEAARWDVASVIVRPEHLHAAADTLRGTDVGLASALCWLEDASETTDPTALLHKAHVLAAAGATEVGLVANHSLLAAGGVDLFEESLSALVSATRPLGVRVRLIIDTTSLSRGAIHHVCGVAARACAWMVQGGSWTTRARLTDVQLMRASLPRDVRVKWTEPVRRLDTMLLSMALGVDRFNADVASLMASATRAELSGPLTIPRAGVDY